MAEKNKTMKKNLIYGMHPVMEAIKSGKQIDKIFVQKGLQGDLFYELIALLKRESIAYKTVPQEKLNKLTRENHQGVAAFISPVVFADLEAILEDENIKKPYTFVILDGITDPRNFGAVIRTAAAVDATAIIIPENNSAPVNEDVVKTSAGGIFKVPIVKTRHLKDVLFLLQSYDVRLVSATEKTDKLVYNANLKDSVAIILGNEAKGIHKSLLQMSDERVKLPMSPHIDSLNISVACGVFLYEVVRQRLS